MWIQSRERNKMALGRKYLLLLVLVVAFTVTKAQEEPTFDSLLDEETLESGDEAPVFLLEPETRYYMVKTKPVTIICQAAPAVQISFKCMDKWIRPRFQTNLEETDETTGIRYLQSSVDITKEEVEEAVGESGAPYWCECLAWNTPASPDQGAVAPKQAISRRGNIYLAVLKKRFEREPLSTVVEAEGTVQLLCLPPEGLPMPEVFWLRNGEEIDVDKEIGYIISSEGNLIIPHARLEDTANYTCGAQNLAGRRLSESARLTVYVNGGWSTWSPWTECSRRCIGGFRRRVRTCDQPLPVNGQPCAGENQQRQNCSATCPVDGDWSTWSSWSTCGEDCHHHRRRVCGDPAPQRGGRECDGSDVDIANCSTHLCQDGRGGLRGTDYNGAVTSEPKEEKVAILVGLAAALLVFIVGATVVTLVVRRRLHSRGWCLTGSGRDKFEKDSGGALFHGGNGLHSTPLHQPDLTQTVVTIQNPHTLQHDGKPTTHALNGTLARAQNGGVQSLQRCATPASSASLMNGSIPDGSLHNTSLGAGSGSGTGNGEAGEHIYSNIDTLTPEKADSVQRSLHRLLVNGSGSESGSNGGGNCGAVNERTGLLSESRISDCETRPNSLYSVAHGGGLATGNGGLNGPPPPPRGLDGALVYQAAPDCVLVYACVDCRGGRLSLHESGVSVTIPEGAVAPGCTEEIYLAVCRDSNDRPQLHGSQTLLGPVLALGPPGLALLKPVVLSFQHCASIKHGQWKLCIYGSETPSPTHTEPAWELATTLGQETINTDVYVHLDGHQCHVMTDMLQRYTLVGEPSHARRAIKILRLAVFAPRPAAAVASTAEMSLRVYVLEDTRDAFENVRQLECEFGGRLVSEKPRQILFQYGAGDLTLSVDQLSPGWRCKLGANYHDIPFLHIWSGIQSGLHASFILERVDRSQQYLEATVYVTQRDQPSNSQTLQISAPLTEGHGGSHSSPAHSVQHYLSTSLAPNGLVPLDAPHTVFRLPLEVKQQLGRVLDPPNARGNDWRMLTQRLGVDRYINYFATKTSPTEHILLLWEARHRDDSAITELMNSLRAMGRTDATAILETAYQAWL